jgi:hypothetical protein
MIARWAGLPMSESVQGTRNGTPPTRGDLDLMPRYFFDIEDGTTSMRDAEGSELADLRTAQREAADSLIEMAAMCSAASSMGACRRPSAPVQSSSLCGLV